MVLVYTHKITPRLTYIFKHIFENMLGVSVGFTKTIETFVAHSGPKFSYTIKQLGDEYFIPAHILLYEQGVKLQTLDVERLDGFSGHSDYNQLMSFVQRLRPKLRRVLVNHGERSKSENLAMNIRRTYKLAAHYPQVQEAIKLF